MSGQLQEIAEQVVKMAIGRGATAAECTLNDGDEFSVNIRKGDVESLKEAGSRSAGLRVLFGKRTGSSYTSDLTKEGLERMVGHAVDIAQITTEDPFAGLPDPEELGKIDGDLGLYSNDIDGVSASEKIERAREAERAAFATDPRIANSEGSSMGSYSGSRVFANSLGFSGAYKSSSCSISVVPVAKSGESMERDYWYSLARSWSGLESAEHVGRMAALRAVRRLDARKVPTQKAKIVFEPRTARSLLDNVYEAVSGDAIYRKASFLAGKLGEKIASEKLTIVDDATIPGLFGTSPFDDEGVPSRRTVVIEKGVLKSYLLNSYTARKLGLKTTGNASRGLTGNAGIGHGNLYIEKGELTPEEIYKQVGTGLLVTELIGFGVNIVTGDYSRGAAGVWIENGELAYPVSEITIAGHLKPMLEEMEFIGSDLEFRGSTAAPTLVIHEMTISGQ